MKQWVMRMKEFEMIDLQIMAHRTTAFVCSTTTFVGLTFWAGRGEASKRPFPKGTAKPPWLTVGAKSHLWSEDGVLGWPRNGEVETKATHAIKNDFYRTCMWHLTATYIMVTSLCTYRRPCMLTPTPLIQDGGAVDNSYSSPHMFRFYSIHYQMWFQTSLKDQATVCVRVFLAVRLTDIVYCPRGLYP